MNEPARTWVLTDGAAGNEKQALALALALGGKVEVARIGLAAPYAWLAPQWLRAPWSAVLHAPPPPWPQLAIGCGRRGAAALDALKRAAPAVRTVQVLDPRVDPARFDLLLLPQHDRRRGANVLLSQAALHAIDGAVLAAAHAAFPQFGTLPAPRQLFLLGASHRLARWQWTQLVAALEVARARGSVLVSTSRRTPAALVRRLQHWCGGHDAFLYNGGEPNPYLGLLAWADEITVSPDSVTMLSEACATAVPVYLLPRARLAGKLARLALALQASGRLGHPGAAIVPLRETAALAAEVARRLALVQPATA